MKKYIFLALSILLLVSTSVDARIYAMHHGSGYGFKQNHSVARQVPAKTRTYQTYTKKHPKTGKVYVGRTSGTKSPKENIASRDRNHHRSKDGYGRATRDQSSSNKSAIRGREQQMIDKHRAEGTAAHQINGISRKNPKRQQYVDAAHKEFGPP